jgi:hypothetical protein
VTAIIRYLITLRSHLRAAVATAERDSRRVAPLEREERDGDVMTMGREMYGDEWESCCNAWSTVVHGGMGSGPGEHG